MGGRFEWDSKAKSFSCGEAGLKRTMWQDSDCSVSKQVKTEAAVPLACTDSYYWENSHVKLESGCSGGGGAGDISKAASQVAMPWFAKISLLLSFRLVAAV